MESPGFLSLEDARALAKAVRARGRDERTSFSHLLNDLQIANDRDECGAEGGFAFLCGGAHALAELRDQEVGVVRIGVIAQQKIEYHDAPQRANEGVQVVKSLFRRLSRHFRLHRGCGDDDGAGRSGRGQRGRAVPDFIPGRGD